MQKFITLAFRFCEKIYSSIILVKKNKDRTVYQITVMNGDLEKLLYGNHRIYEKNGVLEIEPCANKEQQLLKTRIAEALSQMLRLPFTSPGESALSA
ncbi:MAG: hypothetical protein EOO01_24620 [Chitinophagaceae bacterium]|nr:MAG: hypothetical protein EOO01_24620 [Chitinophagaceae bacterium]